MILEFILLIIFFIAEDRAAPRNTSPRGPSRPTSKPVSKPPNPPAVQPKPKKSTVNRREELLKQLKAVEDAIARKKTKMDE